MIGALRRRHFRWSLALSVLLPPLYLLLVLQNPPRSPAGPVVETDSLGRQPAGAPIVLLARPHVVAELLASPAQAPAAIRIVPGEDPAIPDLLAYWAPAPGNDSSLPPDAALLGALRGNRSRILSLPDPHMMRGGYLVLYSLGWRRMIAAAALPAGP